MICRQNRYLFANVYSAYQFQLSLQMFFINLAMVLMTVNFI